MTFDFSAAVSILESAANIAKNEINLSIKDGRMDWSAISKNTISSVVNILGELPLVRELIGRMVVYINGASVFDLNSVALHITHHAIYKSASVVLEDFLSICENRTVCYTEVRLLSCVDVLSPIDLGDGFVLVPLSHVPTNNFTIHLVGEKNVPSHGWGQPPSGAVIRSNKFKLEFRDPPELKGDIVSPIMGVGFDGESRWRDTISSVVLASDGVPEFRQQYFLVDSPGWFFDYCSSFGGSENFPRPSRKASFVNAEIAKKSFLWLNNKNKTINMAIGILEQSRRRLSKVERALDLGLCAEILLMSGSKNGSEIIFKISSRAAWLLGGNASERISIFNDAKAMYKDRSRAAHVGDIGEAKNMEEMERQLNRLNRSDQLCVNLILKLMEKGVPRDWDLVTLDAI